MWSNDSVENSPAMHRSAKACKKSAGLATLQSHSMFITLQASQIYLYTSPITGSTNLFFINALRKKVFQDRFTGILALGCTSFSHFSIFLALSNSVTWGLGC
jgi:hypothetical protein